MYMIILMNNGNIFVLNVIFIDVILNGILFIFNSVIVNGNILFNVNLVSGIVIDLINLNVNIIILF